MKIIAMGFLLCAVGVFAFDNCYRCGNTGVVECGLCNGTGCGGECITCNGTGIAERECLSCSGSGRTYGGQKCFMCGGRGFKSERCMMCRGSGCGFKCVTCRGTGQVACSCKK